ncbi:MAG: PfkB family carbohydrate kinase [Sulfolobales archaeon]|nr:PfkB family carbohydrate kinase [Sulfolobales archaeon]MCX8198544.1 PfkB family carbohydrate kinase [Sulfolobales archaeon]MDW8169617.1 PfkB family carbohydrate kinase [Desulfurococcaceae archaeon]
MSDYLKSLLIGNISLDLINSGIRLGGSVIYGGITLASLKADVVIATHLDEIHGVLIEDLLKTFDIRALFKNCKTLPKFIICGGKALEVEAEGCVHDLRTLVNIVSDLKPNLLLLVPVFREISVSDSLELISTARRIGVRVIGIDIQGYVRSIKDRGLECSWPKDLWSLLEKVTIVHGNLREFCFNKDFSKVVKELAEVTRSIRDTAIVASMDDEGAYLFIQGEVIKVPPLLAEVQVIDDVGAGDVLLAAASYYMTKGLTSVEAVARGIAAASLKVARGLLQQWFTIDEIDNYSNIILNMLKHVQIKDS